MKKVQKKKHLQNIKVQGLLHTKIEGLGLKYFKKIRILSK